MLKDRIKKLRKANKMSQEEFAEKLFVSRSLVAKWELGQRYPSTDLIHDIAKLFNVPYDKLIKDDADAIESGDELEACIPGEISEPDSDRDAGAEDEPLAALADRLTGFLTMFSRDDRTLFLRRYYFYDSVRKISSSRNLTEDEVRVRLADVRAKLLSFLEKEGNN